MFEAGIRLERLPRLAYGAMCMLVGLAVLQACSDDEPPKVIAGLNYEKLTRDGKTCQGGGPRPCYAPLHTEPNFSAESINKTAPNAEGQLVPIWPYEGYEHKPDSFEIVCQVQGDGELVRDAFGNTSNIWDVAVAPAQYVDPNALERIKAGSLNVGHETAPNGEITAVYFYTPAPFVTIESGKSGPSEQFPACNDTQNPKHFAVAH